MVGQRPAVLAVAGATLAARAAGDGVRAYALPIRSPAVRSPGLAARGLVPPDDAAAPAAPDAAPRGSGRGAWGLAAGVAPAALGAACWLLRRGSRAQRGGRAARRDRVALRAGQPESEGQQATRRGAVAAVALAGANSAAGAASAAGQYPLKGTEEIMSKKAHGTSPRPVQENLRYNVDRNTADRICSFNRHFAEFGGYFQRTSWLKDVKDAGEVTYYDSVTGKPLFIAPRGRTLAAFVEESKVHGWPSFRDEEVVWENVRCLKDGECISVDGTHLGHNIPDGKNRYCINLVSVAGNPAATVA